MSKLHERIGDLLAEALDARTAWDEPPALYSIHLPSLKVQHGLYNPALVKWPVDDQMWDANRAGMRTTDILESFSWFVHAHADLFRKVDEEGKARHIYGMGFRHEGWALPESHLKPGTAERSEAYLASSSHTIYKHPDRIETRSFVAVDRARVSYMARLARGETRAERFVIYPGQPGVSAQGTIIEALDRLLEAVTGTPAPARRQGW